MSQSDLHRQTELPGVVKCCFPDPLFCIHLELAKLGVQWDSAPDICRLEEILHCTEDKMLHNALTEFSITLTVLSRDGVTIDEVWIGKWSYLTFTLVTANIYDSLTELHTPKITVTTAHMESSHSSLAVAW
jgi:hypothetical protein